MSKGGKAALRKISECIDKGISFTQETTLSGRKTEATAKQVRDLGYHVRLFYIGLDSAEESLSRIANRVKRGGHDIPHDDVVRRFAGRGFAVAGGVAQAVADLVKQEHPDMEVKTARAEGLRDCRKLMTMAKAGKYKGYLLEGMACPGGCVAGAGTILPIDKAQKFVEKYSKEAASASPLESPYRNAGEHLD